MNVATVRHYVPIGEAPTDEQILAAGGRAAAAWRDDVEAEGLTVYAPPIVALALMPDRLAIRYSERAVVAYGQARRPHGLARR